MIKITFETNSPECINALTECYSRFNGIAAQQPLNTPVTAEQLNDAMTKASIKLNDNGSACYAIINSFGVQSIAQMTPAQLEQAMVQVRAL